MKSNSGGPASSHSLLIKLIVVDFETEHRMDTLATMIQIFAEPYEFKDSFA